MKFSLDEIEAISAVAPDIDKEGLRELLARLTVIPPPHLYTMTLNSYAISYTRFSSVAQAEGDSFRRQTEAAAKYAEANGLVLDTTRSFRDLGVSAYDRSNVKKGALGLFLKAAESGQIPIGTTLIVESLDRLSRAQVLDALEVFVAILNAGLFIVTLADNQKYSRESVSANFGQLLTSIVIMQRAHEESATKSLRISASWQDKKKRAKDGTLMSAKAPHWIDVQINPNSDKRDPNRRRAALIPERVEVVKRIIGMAEQGVGNHTIIKTLHADGVPAWSSSGRWEPSYIQKTLHNPALYGGIEIDGEVIEGYYPPIIDQDRFQYLTSLRANRATTKNTNRKGKTVTNLFSGLLKCGYCGSAMNIAGYKSRVSGYERKYVACHGARTGSTDCKMKMWFIDELEPALLFWITSVDYNKILGTGQKTDLDGEQIKLAGLENQLAEARSRIERTMIAIEEGATSMVPRLQKHETDAAQLQKIVATQRKKVDALVAHESNSANRMKSLIVLFKALKHTTDEVQLRTLREQLATGIASTIAKITLFPAGRTRDGEKEDRFAVVEFKNGASRTIEPGEC